MQVNIISAVKRFLKGAMSVHAFRPVKSNSQRSCNLILLWHLSSNPTLDHNYVRQLGLS